MERIPLAKCIAFAESVTKRVAGSAVAAIVCRECAEQHWIATMRCRLSLVRLWLLGVQPNPHLCIEQWPCGLRVSSQITAASTTIATSATELLRYIGRSRIDRGRWRGY